MRSCTSGEFSLLEVERHLNAQPPTNEQKRPEKQGDRPADDSKGGPAPGFGSKQPQSDASHEAVLLSALYSPQPSYVGLRCNEVVVEARDGISPIGRLPGFGLCFARSQSDHQQ